jgi:hypothetical protein
MSAEQMQHPGGQPPRVPDQSAENHGDEDGENGRDRAPRQSQRSRARRCGGGSAATVSATPTMGSRGFQAAPSTYGPEGKLLWTNR